MADRSMQSTDLAGNLLRLLRTSQEFSTIALSIGLRWTIDQMGTEVAEQVRQEVLGAMPAGG